MAETVVTRFTALAKKVTELSQQLNRAAVDIKACSDPIAPYRSCEQEEAGREHPGTLRLRSSRLWRELCAGTDGQVGDPPQGYQVASDRTPAERKVQSAHPQDSEPLGDRECRQHQAGGEVELRVLPCRAQGSPQRVRGSPHER